MKNLARMGLAVLLSVGFLQAQELFSLDEWVKAQGLTPAIDGGTAGTREASNNTVTEMEENLI